MQPLRWAAIGALLLAMPGAQAQQASRTPDPADPSAPVPPLVYRSALSEHTPPPQAGPSPDKTWRAANDSVAGHAGNSAPLPAPRKDEAPQHSRQQHRQHRQHQQHQAGTAP